MCAYINYYFIRIVPNKIKIDNHIYDCLKNQREFYIAYVGANHNIA